MKKIGFVGVYDKIDMILCVAKLLNALDKKVLVIDATIMQKAKYIVPVVSPSKSYITEYNGIDVAVGLGSFESINEFLGNPESATLNYDYVLLDVDTPQMIQQYNLITFDINYFVTSMDLYSMKRGLQALEAFDTVQHFIKIYFSRDMSKEDDDYFNFLSVGYKVEWDNDKIYFPFEVGDGYMIIQNQKTSKIRINNLSKQYIESVMYIVENIVGENINKQLKRIVKKL